MNKTVLPNISIKEKLNSEEFENLSTPVENALLDTRKKLADIDKEFADYVFLAKPVYERNGQTTEVQGMVHIGPKGFYEKINEDIEKSEIALHEGSFSEDPANGLRFSDEKRKKSSKNFVDQMAYLRMNDGDIAADISNEEINRIMAGKLSEKEFEYWIKRREIGGMVAKSLPDLIKHWIQKSFTKK